MTIRITVNEIELICKSLIQKLKNHGIEYVDIDTDYYWIVTTDEWDDFTSSPDEISVGSLIDDWESLKKILEQQNIVTFVDYERFANILRAVAEAITSSKE